MLTSKNLNWVGVDQFAVGIRKVAVVGSQSDLTCQTQ